MGIRDHRRASPDVVVDEGDLFHINPGDYHYIENNTVGDYTIAINLDYETSNDLLSVWDYMWKNGGEWYK